MSHEIETHADGTASFVSARVDAWHQLGTVLPENFTAEQAMEHAFLGGWNVRKVPLFAEGFTGREAGESFRLEVPDKYATVRTNPKSGDIDVLGVVGSQYEVVQNETHCELLNTLVDESGAHFETAGSLRDGREVFVTMKMPESILVGGADRVDLYIAALNSHDGTSAFRLLTTPVRVVCANTQAAALNNHEGSYLIRHTSRMNGRIEQAREALKLTFAYAEAFQAEAEKMIQKAMTEAQFLKIVKKLYPEPKNATDRQKNRFTKLYDTMTHLFTEADTQAEIRNTRWAGYQAIVEYYDHEAPVRGGRKNGVDFAAIARAERTLTAHGVLRRKNRAFDLLKV